MLTEFAPAKINLYLHVTDRRADGYHLLDSLVAFADIGDNLTLTEAGQTSIYITGTFAVDLAAEPPEQNLAVKALEIFRALFSLPQAYRISLEKNLPVAAGIGGGSSDAAAVLRILARVNNIPLNDVRLLAIAEKLGADVPVCLDPRTAYFSGVGETLSRGPDLPEQAGLLLVNPRVPVPTPAVFKAFKDLAIPFAPRPKLFHQTDLLVPSVLASRVATRENTLTDAAIHAAPVIEAVLKAIAATDDCLLVRMSGSGATCFGLYPTREAAALASQNIGRREWWVRSGAFYRP